MRSNEEVAGRVASKSARPSFALTSPALHAATGFADGIDLVKNYNVKLGPGAELPLVLFRVLKQLPHVGLALPCTSHRAHLLRHYAPVMVSESTLMSRRMKCITNNMSVNLTNEFV